MTFLGSQNLPFGDFPSEFLHTEIVGGTHPKKKTSLFSNIVMELFLSGLLLEFNLINDGHHFWLKMVTNMRKIGNCINAFILWSIHA